MNLDRLVEALGRLDARSLHLEREGVYDAPEPERLAEEVYIRLFRHRVGDVAVDRLGLAADLDPAHPFVAQLTRRLRLDPRHEGCSPEKTVGIVKSLAGGDDLVFIKGSALATAYPAPFRRDHGDIDVVLRSFDALWSLLESAAPHFSFQKLKVYQYANVLGGGIDLQPPTESDLLLVDVHVGGYHMWGANRYGQNLWARAQRIDGRLLPSWEDSLLLIAAHCCTGWIYRQRDLNDVYAIVTHARSLDWDYVERASEAENLRDILAVLLQETERVYARRLHEVSSLRRLSVAARVFAGRNYARSDRLGAVLQQTQLTLPRYRRDFGLAAGTLQSLRNGINLVRFDNRAFVAGRRRRLRRITPNEILILLPIAKGQKGLPPKGRSIGPESFRVVEEQTPHEHFLTPCGIFVQGPYHGGLSDDERANLRSVTLPVSGSG